MLKNFWEGLSFYCMNGHDDPVPMTVMTGSSAFYACPKYMLKDEEHPEGHEYGERACANRISFVDAERIVSKLSDEVSAAYLRDEIPDMTGYSFSFKTINVKVLRFKEGDIRLGIVNRKAVR